MSIKILCNRIKLRITFKLIFKPLSFLDARLEPRTFLKFILLKKAAVYVASIIN